MVKKCIRNSSLKMYFKGHVKGTLTRITILPNSYATVILNMVLVSRGYRTYPQGQRFPWFGVVETEENRSSILLKPRSQLRWVIKPLSQKSVFSFSQVIFFMMKRSPQPLYKILWKEHCFKPSNLCSSLPASIIYICYLPMYYVWVFQAVSPAGQGEVLSSQEEDQEQELSGII